MLRLKSLTLAFIAAIFLLTIIPLPLAEASPTEINPGDSVTGTIKKGSSFFQYVVRPESANESWSVRLTVTVDDPANYQVWLTAQTPSGYEPITSMEFTPTAKDPNLRKTSSGFIYETETKKYSGNQYIYTISVPEHYWRSVSNAAVISFKLELNQSPRPSLDRFTDIKSSAWYYPYVEYVVGERLFDGTGASTFSPDATMTRAMIVTVLGRWDGINTNSYKTQTFTDVSSSDYYAPYVNWASSLGLVNGVGHNKFDPNGKLSRQDLVVVLYRYAKYKGGDTSIPTTLESFYKFNDWAICAEYALDPLKWAVGHEIISGYTPTWLYPELFATRAQVAKIFATSKDFIR